MIRVDSVVNLRPLDNLIGFAQRFPHYVAVAAKYAFDQSKPKLLDPLRAQPSNRAVHPFVWSTDPAANARGRRAYFELVRRGLIQTDDYGSIRTGALAQGYDAQMFISNNEILVQVTNSETRAYRYTKGRRQVPGHAATGWMQDAPIITQWVAGFRVSLIEELITARQALATSS